VVSTLSEKISEYIIELKQSKIQQDVIELVKERIADSIAVMIGAYDAPPVRIIRESLKDFVGKGVTGIGLGKLSPDHAAFLN